MKVSKKLLVSIIFAAAVLVLSMFASIVPCKTAAVIPNPQYQWKLCDQNPDMHVLGIDKLYFGYTNIMTQSYLITLAIAFLLCFGLLSILSRGKKE